MQINAFGEVVLLVADSDEPRMLTNMYPGLLFEVDAIFTQDEVGRIQGRRIRRVYVGPNVDLESQGYISMCQNLHTSLGDLQPIHLGPEARAAREWREKN